MPSQSQKLTRIAYAASQFAAVFFQFAGSISSFFEYEANRNHAHVRKPAEYITVITVSAIAASIFLVTANKFQGVKIMEDVSTTETHHANEAKSVFTYDEAPRNRKSNLFEASYLVFAALLTVTNNYFTLAGMKAYFDAFSHPNHVKSILPLNAAGLTIMAVKTIFCDLPFNFTNASYEAAEEIKEEVTGSKDGPLVSLLVKPLANKTGLFWITTIGTITHAIWDFTGLLLCIPPEALLSGLKHPNILWPLMAAGAVFIVTPLAIVNLAQTRYFEAKESEINLNSLIKNPRNPLLPKPKEKKTLLYHFLTRWPWLKTPLRYGFYTQGPLHAFADAMPALLFLRHIIPGSLNKQLAIALPIAALVWLASTKGTNDSEVKYSIHHFDNEFRSIGKQPNMNPNTSHCIRC